MRLVLACRLHHCTAESLHDLGGALNAPRQTVHGDFNIYTDYNSSETVLGIKAIMMAVVYPRWLLVNFIQIYCVGWDWCWGYWKFSPWMVLSGV